jgi:hypothetical protein
MTKTVSKTTPIPQEVSATEKTLLFVESSGLIVELVKTFYGYKVCKSGRRAKTSRHFGGNYAALEAADYFLECT